MTTEPGPTSPADLGLDAWRERPAAQQPSWPDDVELREVALTLAAMPPLVVASEVDQLRERLAAVARGDAFLLQGGDCAETFVTSTQADIAAKVRVLLQMAVVLTYGASVPVVKLGRIAGQYAKPRSAELDASGQRSYRGDMVNELIGDRTPDPRRILRAYSTAASTLNLLRAYAGGGLASLDRVHAWNAAFARSTETGARYEKLAAEIDRAVRFMRACGVHDAALEGRGAVRLARGADPRVRAGADPDRRRPGLRPVGPLRLGRRAHPPDGRRPPRLRLAHRQPDRGQARPDDHAGVRGRTGRAPRPRQRARAG